MNEEEKEKFHDYINQQPYWIRNEEDWSNYATHLNYRLYQKKTQFDKLLKYLKTYHNEVYVKINNEDSDHVYKEYYEMDDEYIKREKKCIKANFAV